jgi:hypothetical protein
MQKKQVRKGNWVHPMHNFLKTKLFLKQTTIQKLNDLETKLLTKNNFSDRQRTLQSGQLDGRTLK